MKKLKKIAIIAGTIALMGGGCSSAPVELPAAPQIPEGFSTHSADAWSISYPSDWVVQRNPENLDQTFFYSPFVKDEAEFEHNVNVVSTVVPEQVELDDLLDVVVNGLDQGGAVVGEKGTSVLPAGENLFVEYTITQPESDETLYGKQVGLYGGNKLYVVTFTANKDGWDAFLVDFEDMVEQLKTF